MAMSLQVMDMQFRVYHVIVMVMLPLGNNRNFSHCN